MGLRARREAPLLQGLVLELLPRQVLPPAQGEKAAGSRGKELLRLAESHHGKDLQTRRPEAEQSEERYGRLGASS